VIEMDDWDKYFFEIAKAVSTKSKCLRRQYGAIIVNEDRVLVSTGFNGTPFGVKDCVVCKRDEMGCEPGERYDLCRSIHAEENAIVFAGMEKAKGGVMYLYGELSEPCTHKCKKLILNVGITKVMGYDGRNVLVFNPREWVEEL